MNRILDKLGIPYKRNNENDIIIKDFNIKPIKAVEKMSYLNISNDTIPGDTVYCINENKFYAYDGETKRYESLNFI